MLEPVTVQMKSFKHAIYKIPVADEMKARDGLNNFKALLSVGGGDVLGGGSVDHLSGVDGQVGASYSIMDDMSPMNYAIIEREMDKIVFDASIINKQIRRSTITIGRSRTPSGKPIVEADVVQPPEPFFLQGLIVVMFVLSFPFLPLVICVVFLIYAQEKARHQSAAAKMQQFFANYSPPQAASAAVNVAPIPTAVGVNPVPVASIENDNLVKTF